MRSACGEGKIAIALEQRCGALFFQLCTHLFWIDLYPINPHSLASFRKTFFSSRAKDDPVDSQLLEELLRTHPERLRPYQSEPTTERKLDQYCRHRRSLLNLATRTELKLISTLKQYFPLAVHLFGEVGLKSDIALNFLSRWPTLDELHKAKAQTLRSFFYAHNSRSQSLIEERIEQIAQAHSVTDDLALIEPLILTTKCLMGFFCNFRVKFMRLTKQRSPGSTRNSAARRLLKVESGINGLLPTSWGPSIYSVSLLIRLRYALEEVTVFCVRPLCARSSRPSRQTQNKSG